MVDAGVEAVALLIFADRESARLGVPVEVVEMTVLCLRGKSDDIDFFPFDDSVGESVLLAGDFDDPEYIVWRFARASFAGFLRATD